MLNPETVTPNARCPKHCPSFPHVRGLINGGIANETSPCLFLTLVDDCLTILVIGFGVILADETMLDSAKVGCPSDDRSSATLLNFGKGSCCHIEFGIVRNHGSR